MNPTQLIFHRCSSYLKECISSINICNTLSFMNSCTFSGLNLLAIIVPVLVAMFIETSKLPSASKPSRALHDYALQHMMKIGPLYPAEFRTIMGSSVDLRTRLESAVKANQASNSSKQAARPVNIKPAQPIKPSITLKTDFSNFTG